LAEGASDGCALGALDNPPPRSIITAHNQGHTHITHAPVPCGAWSRNRYLHPHAPPPGAHLRLMRAYHRCPCVCRDADELVHDVQQQRQQRSRRQQQELQQELQQQELQQQEQQPRLREEQHPRQREEQQHPRQRVHHPVHTMWRCVASDRVMVW
jgi:hypothetical protein